MFCFTLTDGKLLRIFYMLQKAYFAAYNNKKAGDGALAGTGVNFPTCEFVSDDYPLTFDSPQSRMLRVMRGGTLEGSGPYRYVFYYSKYKSQNRCSRF